MMDSSSTPLGAMPLSYTVALLCPRCPAEINLPINLLADLPELDRTLAIVKHNHTLGMMLADHLRDEHEPGKTERLERELAEIVHMINDYLQTTSTHLGSGSFTANALVSLLIASHRQFRESLDSLSLAHDALQTDHGREHLQLVDAQWDVRRLRQSLSDMERQAEITDDVLRTERKKIQYAMDLLQRVVEGNYGLPRGDGIPTSFIQDLISKLAVIVPLVQEARERRAEVERESDDG